MENLAKHYGRTEILQIVFGQIESKSDGILVKLKSLNRIVTIEIGSVQKAVNITRACNVGSWLVSGNLGELQPFS